MLSDYSRHCAHASPVRFTEVGSSDFGEPGGRVPDEHLYLILRNKSAVSLASLPEGPLRSMLRRFGYAMRHNRAVCDLGADVWVAKLGERGAERRAAVADCGWRLNVAPGRSASGGVRVVNTWFCGDRICCVCAVRRSNRLLARYGEHVRAVEERSHLYGLTLTVRDTEELRPSFRSLTDGLSRFFAGRRRLVDHPLRRSLGCIASTEIKRGAGGSWHPHTHCLVAADKLDYAATRNEWLRCAPSSQWIYCFRVVGPAFRAAVETLKYSLKRELQAPIDVLDMVRVTRGARMVRSFGCFYGLGKHKPEKVATTHSFVWDGTEYEVDSGKTVDYFLPCDSAIERLREC